MFFRWNWKLLNFDIEIDALEDYFLDFYKAIANKNIDSTENKIINEILDDVLNKKNKLLL